MGRRRKDIWYEGDPLWTWREGESVPRYKHHQICQGAVVDNLNNLEKQLKEQGELIAQMRSDVSAVVDKLQPHDSKTRRYAK